jgi:hypothetical protein
MLVRLTRVVRSRCAGVLAVLYLVCILSPAAAFAFGDGSQTSHCLTEASLSAHVHGTHVHGSGGAASPHSHAEGTPAQHSHDPASHSHDGGVAADSTCCGLFCVSSLAADLIAASPDGAPGSTAVFPIAQEIAGSGPDRLYRPPITSLSI